jgi:hypothetical protein
MKRPSGLWEWVCFLAGRGHKFDGPHLICADCDLVSSAIPCHRCGSEHVFRCDRAIAWKTGVTVGCVMCRWEWYQRGEAA